MDHVFVSIDGPCTVSTVRGSLSCVRRLDGPCPVSTARWISSDPICLLGILGDWRLLFWRLLRLLLGVPRLLDDGRQVATVVETTRSPTPPLALSRLPTVSPAPATPHALPPLPPLSLFSSAPAPPPIPPSVPPIYSPFSFYCYQSGLQPKESLSTGTCRGTGWWRQGRGDELHVHCV